jgi:hypothetical protein
MGQWKQQIKVHKHDYQEYTDTEFNSQKVEAGSIWTCSCGQDFRLSWKREQADYGQGMTDVPRWSAVRLSEPVDNPTGYGARVDSYKVPYDDGPGYEVGFGLH